MAAVSSGKDFYSPFEPKKLLIDIDLIEKGESTFFMGIHIFDSMEREVLVLDSACHPSLRLEPRSQRVVVELAHPWLKPGDYRVDVNLYNCGIIDACKDALQLRVSNESSAPGGMAFAKPTPAIVLPSFSIHSAPLSFDSIPDQAWEEAPETSATLDLVSP